MARASSWGAVGTEHTLDSANFGFLSDVQGSTSSCASSRFTLDVASTTVIEITSATFTGCTWVGSPFGSCTMTSTGTNFPWTATAVTTSNIQIHGVSINMLAEHHPSSGTCNLANMTVRITGTLSAARWTGNTTPRTIVITGSTGLVAHGLFVAPAITPVGAFIDTQNTLVVTN